MTEPGSGIPSWPAPTQPTQPIRPAPPAAPTQSRRVPWSLAIGAVLLAAGGMAGWALLADGDGTGSFDIEVSTDRLTTRSLTVPAGDALAVVVEPDEDVDAVVALLVDESDAEQLDELYEELDLIEPLDGREAFPAVAGDGADPGDQVVVVLRADVGFAGEDEVLVLPTPRELDVVVAVGPFGEEDAGGATLTLTTAPLGTTEDAGAEELLGAAADADGLPRPARALAAELRPG